MDQVDQLYRGNKTRPQVKPKDKGNYNYAHVSPTRYEVRVRPYIPRNNSPTTMPRRRTQTGIGFLVAIH